MLGAILQTAIHENVWIALVLFVFVWLFSWAKGGLGSAKLAVLFAIIVVYLTFYQFPILIWIVVIVFVLATFGKELISKLNPLEGGDQLR
ncbi:MAG: hypothetical protein HYW50_00230 [Candidatus Diapherotrites archaeon]|nr:hypothetical protein [Candidatus Diapherotrites archaeon]